MLSSCPRALPYLLLSQPFLRGAFPVSSFSSLALIATPTALQLEKNVRRLNRYRTNIFDDFLLAPFVSPFNSYLSHFQIPAIAVNLYSTPTNYQILAQVSGAKKEEIVVSVENGMLIIEVDRNEHTQSKPNISIGSGEQSKLSSMDIKDKLTKESISSVSQSDKEDVKELQAEFHYGKTIRSFSLPDDAAIDGVTAKYEDGMIRIDIPRKQLTNEKKKIVQLQ